MEKREYQYYKIKKFYSQSVIACYDKDLNTYFYINDKWNCCDHIYFLEYLLGFDESEPEDSPYRFGNFDDYSIDYVTKEEAEEFIGKKIDEKAFEKIPLDEAFKPVF